MARKFDRQAVIAQRTKRLVSIGTKLYYNPKMKLTQMQDVGGCRYLSQPQHSQHGALTAFHVGVGPVCGVSRDGHSAVLTRCEN